VLVIVVEHVWIAGLVLALALPGGHLPRHDDPAPPRQGRFQSLGFGLVPGEHGISAWLGIPTSAWPALLGQAVLFGAIHISKDAGELIASFPGGLALGLITYRVGSIWPTVALHAGTSAVVLLVVALAR
jgi:hypothetical protein